MAEENVWTINRCLTWTRDYLARKGDDHARLSAEWLLSAATGKDRTGLYMAFDEPLSLDELSRMHGFIERRAKGEPLQYITGKTSFRFIEVACAPGVLIPRPETELLVDAALEGIDAASAMSPVRVLEVGCGTGCVSCAIASERPGTLVTATDISPTAAALARENRDALGLASSVDIIECDLVSGVSPELMGTFAVLVSNPPYIPDDVMRKLPDEVANFEPELALAGGADGLDVYRRLLDAAPRALVPGGMLAVELHEDALDAAADLARKQGCWKSIEIRRDLTGRTRFIVARLAGELPAAAPVHEPEGRIVPCNQDEPSSEVIADAASVLRAGGVVVMPTDSVYGIGAAATPDNPGHRRIFDIKRRDLAQTLPLLVSDASELDRLAVDVPAWAHTLAERLWPGALTLVVHASEAVPREFQRENGTVALRVPNSALVRELAREVGPLAVTSANTHGMPAPATSDDIERRIADAADLTLAAGPTPAGAASTIVDTTSGEPHIVRQGPIPEEVIATLAH